MNRFHVVSIHELQTFEKAEEPYPQSERKVIIIIIYFEQAQPLKNSLFHLNDLVKIRVDGHHKLGLEFSNHANLHVLYFFTNVVGIILQ